MANFVGGPWEAKPFEVKSDIPFELLNRGLATMQARTDSARQQYQSVLDNMGNTQFLKDTDRQVVNDKIKATVDQMNSVIGDDLTNDQVNMNLANSLSSLTNDDDILTRISSNRNALKELNRINTIKLKHPESYNPINEQYFHKQLNSWISDPNQKSFNGRYQNAVDTSKYALSIKEALEKNPDIVSGVENMVVNGKLIPRTNVEIKKLAKEKLYSALMSSLPSDVRSQLELEYKNATYGNQPQVAAAALAADKNRLQLLKEKTQAFLDEHSYAPDSQVKRELQDKLEEINSGLTKLEDLHGKVLRGEADPSPYINADRYINEHFQNIANAYQWKQEKREDSQWGMKLLDGMMDENLEKLKAKLKGEVENIGPGNNEYVNMTNDLFSKGESTISMPTFRALNNISAKPDEKTGAVRKTFTGDDIMIDIRPFIQGIGVNDKDNKKIFGYTEFIHGFNAFKKDYNNKAKQLNKDFVLGSAVKFLLPDVPDQEVMPLYIKELENHKLDDGSSMADQFKKNFNLDIHDTKDIEDIKKVKHTLDEKKIGNYGLKLSNVKGNLDLIPASGMNTFSTFNGGAATAAVSQGTWKQFADIFGEDYLQAIQDADNTNKGITGLGRGFGYEETSPHLKKIGTDENGNKIYQLAINTLPKVDLRTGYANYSNETMGSGVIKDQFPAMYKAYDNILTRKMALAKYSDGDVSDRVEELRKRITSSKNEKALNQLNYLIDILNNPQVDASTKDDAKESIINQYNAINKKSK